MSRVVVTVFGVGQGAMNLIEGYDDKGTLESLILIDCGKSPKSGQDYKEFENTAIEVSISHVRSVMRQRFFASYQKTMLDFLIITHRDEDHLNYIYSLMADSFQVVDDPDGQNKLVIPHGSYNDEYVINRESKTLKGLREVGMKLDDQDGLSLRYHITASGELNILYAFICDEYSLKITVSNNIISIPYHSFLDTSNYHVITARPIYDNSLWVFKDNDQIGTMNFPEECANQYDRFIKTAISMIDQYVKDIDIQRFKNLFDKIEPSFYKTYLEVWGLTQKMTTLTKKPILNCFIGGRPGQEEGTVNFIKEITENVYDSYNPSKDIFQFCSNAVGLRIIKYKSIEELEKIFGEIKNKQTKSNATSVISLLHVSEDFKVLFTGDATRHTFFDCLNDPGIIALMNHSIWTAPHHGSIKTIKPTLRKQQVNVMEKLLEAVDIKGMVISAGHCSIYGHPSGEFIRRFKQYYDNQEVACYGHEICYNNNNFASKAKVDWNHMIINVPVFTSLICEKDNVMYVNQILKYDITNKQLISDTDSISKMRNVVYKPLPLPATGTAKAGSARDIFFIRDKQE